MNLKKKSTEQEIYFRFEFLNLVGRQAVLNIVQFQVNKATDKSLTDSLLLLTSASPMQIRRSFFWGNRSRVVR